MSHHNKRHASTVRIGKLSAERVGLKSRYWGDLYHFLLTTSWFSLLVWVVALYVLFNIGFALLYWLEPGSVEGVHSISFMDLFFFSVQTMATIGYGKLIPMTTFSNILVTIEALLGLLGFALVTGLMFAKFSRPTARVLFSRVGVVSPRDGIPSLMIRMANERSNQIVEAQVHIVLVCVETTLEGEQVRKFYELELSRHRNIMFTLTWTAIHPIDSTSPLFGETAESLAKKNATIIVSLVGIDETFAQTVHARHYYAAHEILWNHRFVDILSKIEDRRIRVDYHRFHDTQPLPSIEQQAV